VNLELLEVKKTVFSPQSHKKLKDFQL